MFHGILYLLFQKPIIVLCVQFLSLEFLNFSLLTLEELVKNFSLSLEPFDRLLELGDVVIVA